MNVLQPRALGLAATLTSLLGFALLASTRAYDCEVVTRESTTNYGPSIDEDAFAALTPFALTDYSGAIAYDEEHCVQMCCEELSCYVAVFDDTEALCYLKGSRATHGYDYVDSDGFTSHSLLFRGGDAEPIDLEPSECLNKRGIAFDFQDASDLDVLSLGMSWWYNWSPAIIPSEVKTAQIASGCEYVPMIWGEKDMTETRMSNLDALGNSSYLLGFNEPNFGAQASLTPAEAAALWSSVKSEAAELGAEIVSPAVNYCSGDCNEEDPIQWLDDFFAECENIEGGCGVTAIAVHTYTCQAQYLNKHLHSYLKYDLPLWLTEFACGDDSAYMSEEGQATFLTDSMLLLELHPDVARYAWFTGRGGADVGIDGCDLLSDNGEMTDLGSIFFDTYNDLQRCGDLTTSLTTSSSSSTVPSLMVVDPGDGEGLDDVDATATEITNVVISNLGGTGTYNEVVDMLTGADGVCPDEYCSKEEVNVTGTLGSFDEPVTVAFRGPMNIYNIAWFEGEADSLTRTSKWAPTTSDNLVFMNNLGGSGDSCSGEWTVCGGNSQSYSDDSGDNCASEPTQFAGKVGGDEEVQIMTSEECASEAACGFYRDVGMEGWAGGSDGTKVMVFEVDMPHCGTDDFSDCEKNRPAVWALNAKVTRTAQYGCNCRGMGGNGGCGEFDIVEAVVGNEYADMLFTTAYDFKGTGSPGEDKYFHRPSAPTHFAAIFRGGDDAYLQVVRLTDFDYSQTSLTGATLDELHTASSEHHEIYDVPA